jgi:hypothetical protein
VSSSALERALHKGPDWINSIHSARQESGFSFDQNNKELWIWLSSGGHQKVLEIARREVNSLGAEMLYTYYLSCFYSRYELAEGNFDFKKIMGPPWIKLDCPAAKLCEDWWQSIRTYRKKIDDKLKQAESGLVHGDITKDFIEWFFQMRGAQEIAQISLGEVNKLKLGTIYASFWLCCLLPKDISGAMEASGLLQHAPQLQDWQRLNFICPNRAVRQRCRAYPHKIDWNEGGDNLGDLAVSPNLGIHPSISKGVNNRAILNISWDPMIIKGTGELSAAVKELQKHFLAIQKRQGGRSTPLTPLQQNIRQARRGGRISWRPEDDKIALECARLKDEEGKTISKIADKFGFAKQYDDYGNPTRSSTASRYIKRGRLLKSWSA